MRAGFAVVFGLVSLACGKADPDAAKNIGGAAAPLTDQADVKMLDAKVEDPAAARLHKPFVVTKPVDKATEPSDPSTTKLVVPPDDGAPAVAPRDAASGLATGKRQHKPLAIQ